jgi:hypothetical protein
MPMRAAMLALLCLCLVRAAEARELTASERRSLAEDVGAFRQALAAQDVAAVLAFSPPLVTAGKAERMGMAVPDMIKAMAAQTDRTGDAVTIRSIEIDLDAAAGGDAAGEPYLLIPTEIVIVFPGTGTVRESSHLLAFPAAEGWHLMRLGAAEDRALLRRLYPQFAGVALPEGAVARIRP